MADNLIDTIKQMRSRAFSDARTATRQGGTVDGEPRGYDTPVEVKHLWDALALIAERIEKSTTS